MKKQVTTESLDRELRHTAIGAFLVAAAYMATIPLYIIVQNEYSDLSQQQWVLRAETAAKMVDSLRYIFYLSVPIFCVVMIVFGRTLLRNLKQRKQLCDNNKTEPAH